MQQGVQGSGDEAEPQVAADERDDVATSVVAVETPGAPTGTGI